MRIASYTTVALGMVAKADQMTDPHLDSNRGIPKITYLSDPTPSDRLCVLVGDGWDPTAPQLQLSLLADGEPGLPGAKLEAKALKWSAARIVSSVEPQCLTFLLPPGRNGMWVVRAMNGDRAGEPMLMNGACPEWLSTERAHPGSTVRAIGRGLASLDLYPEGSPDAPRSYGGYVDRHRVQVALCSRGRKFVMAEVVKASSYDVHFRLPDDLPLGDYQVFLHNGHGGTLGWSVPLSLTVDAAAPWPTTVFNAKDYGAKGDDTTDETAALQSALDAAEANGGGVVLLPPGKYRFLGSLKMPRRTVLRGADRARVWLYLPQGTNSHDSAGGTAEQGMAIPAFIHGEGDFGVENLNILAVYSPLIIAAPYSPKPSTQAGWDTALATDHYAENVFVRNCRLVHEPTYDYHTRRPDDPLLAGERLLKESRFWHFAAVALRGDHMEVTDCDIKGAGMAVAFVGTRHGLIARNTLRVGSSANCYSLQPTERPWEKIIIEDNTFTIASNLNHSGAWMHRMGRHTYIARNHMHPLFWVCDCESLLFHLQGDKLTCEVAGAGETSIAFDKARIAALRGRTKQAQQYIDESGALKPGVLNGFTAIIVHGPGLGQLRRITDNTTDTIAVDRPWTVQPRAGCTVALCQLSPFIGIRLIDNIVEDGGTGIHFWGCAFESIMDGNRIYRNGINIEDLSSLYRPGGGDFWEFAGCYANQMLHNVVASEGIRAGVAGLYFGARYPDLPAVTGAVGFVARGNVVEKETKLIAEPAKSMPGAFNYLGVVLERNVCRDSAVGIQLGDGVEAVLRGNSFSNVDRPVREAGGHVTHVDD
jgi:hypothetical protein